MSHTVARRIAALHRLRPPSEHPDQLQCDAAREARVLRVRVAHQLFHVKSATHVRSRPLLTGHRRVLFTPVRPHHPVRNRTPPTYATSHTLDGCLGKRIRSSALASPLQA